MFLQDLFGVEIGGFDEDENERLRKQLAAQIAELSGDPGGGPRSRGRWSPTPDPSHSGPAIDLGFGSLDSYGERSAEEAGLVRQDQSASNPMEGLVRAAKEATERFDTKAELEKLIAAGKTASGQRNFMQDAGVEAIPELTSYDDGIAMGVNVDPGRGHISAADQLRKIREQAYQKGGGRGPRGAGGGTFSQGTMTPEIALRGIQLDQYLADRPMRDAQFESDLARQRRDPQGQALASEKILGLQQRRLGESELAITKMLVQELGNSNGTIPFARAMQLRQSGFPIPMQAVGTDPQYAEKYLMGLLNQAQSGLAKIDPMMAGYDPVMKSQADFENNSAAVIMQALEQIRSGGDPDEVIGRLMPELKDYAKETMEYMSSLMPQQQMGE